MATGPYLAQRLSFSGSLCTVRYVGPVQETKGDWLGVEWDDPTRGKHPGEHGGLRYFECMLSNHGTKLYLGKSDALTPGSFVRPSRLADRSLSFLDALRRKYGDDLTASSDTADATKAIEWGGKVVEEVGFEKIRHQLAVFEELQNVLLDGTCLAGLLPGSPGEDVEGRKAECQKIGETCPKIVELDLSRNLLERWKDVLEICWPLEELKVLRASGNRFGSLAADGPLVESTALDAYGKVEELGLDDTLLSWNETVKITASFMKLKKLSASFNNIATLSDQVLPQTITSLTLEGNRITSISDLRPLKTMPNLAILSLRDNRIRNVQPAFLTEKEQMTKFPQSLYYIDLSYNAIETWHFLDELQDALPGLTELRIAHNPLYDEPMDGKMMSEDEAFMLTVGRLGRLKRLDFSQITQNDRTQSDLYYLSQIAHEIAEASEEQEQRIISRHRRYDQLSELYGLPTIRRTAPSASDPNSLGARLIDFTFTFCPNRALPAENGELVSKTKRIPKGFDVYRVKGIAGRLLGLRPMGTRLIWETGELDPVAGYDEYNGSESSGSERNVRDVATADQAPSRDRWVRREVELEDGTREVGFWIEGTKATVRVELR